MKNAFGIVSSKYEKCCNLELLVFWLTSSFAIGRDNSFLISNNSIGNFNRLV